MRSFIAAVRPAAFLAVSLAMFGFAQAADEPDPPSRVARLSLAEGAVSLQPSGTQDWANADINRPLTTGDKLWTDDNSRAELDIGSAAVRLGSTTGFSFLNLDDQATQMQVTAGTVIVRVRSLNEGQSFEVDTPNLAVTLMQPGQYRVELNDAGDTTMVEVSEGQAQAASADQGFQIFAQQKGTFAGTDKVSSVVGTLGAPDDLDKWSLARDRQTQESQSQQYVSADATGVADLDNNGRWEDTPDYGYVWTPTTVAVGWAPYRFGHWVWVAPWGWTWIDDAPWGFAPFHYGRWAYRRDSWCWVPGPRQARAVYAPALVAWVGGPAVGVSVAVGGGVGWFPLGPREVYVPSYRVSPGYVERVNISNTRIVDRTYITNVYENRVTNVTYANRNVRGAVTTVPQNVFTTAQPVGRNRIRVPDNDARNFEVRRGGPAVAPGRDSFVGAGRRVDVRQPPASLINRQVVVNTPPPRSPGSLGRQPTVIRANGGGDSLADRERALRENRIGGGNDNHPAFPARQGFRNDRPGAPETDRPQLDRQPPGRSPANQGVGGRPEDRPQVDRLPPERAPANPGFGGRPAEVPPVDRQPAERPASNQGFGGRPVDRPQVDRQPPERAPPPPGFGGPVDRPQVDRQPPERVPSNQGFGGRPAERPQVDREPALNRPQPRVQEPRAPAPVAIPAAPPPRAPPPQARPATPPPPQRSEPRAQVPRPPERAKALDDHR